MIQKSRMGMGKITARKSLLNKRTGETAGNGVGASAGV
jgi:hypothetical protein